MGDACDMLALLYVEQPDNAANAVRAVDLLRATCARGLVSACSNLGGLYLLGRVVPRDVPRAILSTRTRANTATGPPAPR